MEAILGIILAIQLVVSSSCLEPDHTCVFCGILLPYLFTIGAILLVLLQLVTAVIMLVRALLSNYLSKHRS
jgi:predicted small integral membrane protein